MDTDDVKTQLKCITEALDELLIPHRSKAGAQYTTWGRVALLIEQHKEQRAEIETLRDSLEHALKMAGAQ